MFVDSVGFLAAQPLQFGGEAVLTEQIQTELFGACRSSEFGALTRAQLDGFDKASPWPCAQRSQRKPSHNEQTTEGE